jgi:hypothetical protein
MITVIFESVHIATHSLRDALSSGRGLVQNVCGFGGVVGSNSHKSGNVPIGTWNTRKILIMYHIYKAYPK